MSHSDAAHQRLRAFIFHDLHSPCPDAAGSDVLATCMGDASVVGRIHQLGSVRLQAREAIDAFTTAPAVPPACSALLSAIGGAGKTPLKRESISAAASAYFSATQECRHEIYNLPSLPKASMLLPIAMHSLPEHRRRRSQPRVASLAGAHGFDSRHTLQTAIGLGAAIWDTFLQLMEQSGDVVGVVQAFVSSFASLPLAALRSEHHDEILSADIPPDTRESLQEMHPHSATFTPSDHPETVDASDDKSPPSARVHSLLGRLRRWLRDHPAWKGVAEHTPSADARAPVASASLVASVQLSWQEVDDCLERFVTGKLHAAIANPAAYPDGHLLNSFLELRCRALRTLVGWEQLDCSPPPVSTPLAWQLAVAWLQAMPRFAAPCDKLNCMLNSCSVVSKLLSHTYDAERGSIRTAVGVQVGADDFLPCLIYVILQAAVPTMYTDLQYVQAYRDKTQLLSENGYYFTNITSACNFVAGATPQQLRLTEQQVQHATQQALHAMQTAAAQPADQAHHDSPCGWQSQAAAWERGLVQHACASSAVPGEAALVALRGLCDEHQASCDALAQSEVDSSVLSTLGLAPAPAPHYSGGNEMGESGLGSGSATGAQHDSELIVAALLESDSSESDSGVGAPSAAPSCGPGAGAGGLEQTALRVARRALQGLPDAKLANKSPRRLVKLREKVGNSAPQGEFESQLARLRAVLVDAQLLAAV